MAVPCTSVMSGARYTSCDEIIRRTKEEDRFRVEDKIEKREWEKKNKGNLGIKKWILAFGNFLGGGIPLIFVSLVSSLYVRVVAIDTNSGKCFVKNKGQEKK